MKFKDWLYFVMLSLAWGSSFLFIKIGVQEVGPATLVSFRLLFGLIGLAAVTLYFKPKFPTERNTWLALILLGITNTTLPFVLISWGEQYIDSSVAAVLNATVPIFAVLLSHYLLHDEKITVVRLTGVVIGFAGVVVLMNKSLGVENFTQNLLGQGAVVLASLLYAVSSVFARRRLTGVPPMVQALVTVAVADFFSWILVFSFEPMQQLPQLPLTWFSFAWLGLVGSCTAYLLYFSLIRNIGATKTTMVTYFMPPIGVVLGLVFLGEQLDWYLALSFVLIVGSVWLVNKKG
ncbi:MAG: EamA family transporter [Ignavibacteriae bacterium]|nr:EamA family transporter [Ignavibacteriota bacterium]